MTMSIGLRLPIAVCEGAMLLRGEIYSGCVTMRVSFVPNWTVRDRGLQSRAYPSWNALGDMHASYPIML